MRFRTHLKKLQNIYRRKGLLFSVQYATKRLFLERVNNIIYEATLDADVPAKVRLPGIEFEIFKNRADIPSALFGFINGDSIPEYLEGLPTGDVLLAASESGKYLHFGFVLLHSRQLARLGEKHPAPLIANCYTSPEARGRGLYRCALIEEIRYLKSQGHRRVLIETSSENVPSQRAIEAAGFRLIRRMNGFVVLRKFAAQWVTTAKGKSFRIWIV
jgi:RimJ/RimL family protein N-acetyltransferase